MPELPEVQTVVSFLLPQVGKKILSFSSVKSLSFPIEGKTIDSIERVGKHILFTLDDRSALLIHLKVNGAITLALKGEELPRFTVHTFSLEDGIRICLVDPRKFIDVQYFQQKEEAERYLDAKLGKDALEITPQELHSLLRKDKRSIKEALMDQKVVAGIGNIYCAEALFDTRVAPFTEARKVDEGTLAYILDCNSKRMNQAIQDGLKVIDDPHFILKDGWMDISMHVYQKHNTPCPRCGAPIKRVLINQRGTYYCSCCQRPHKGPYVVAVTGRIHSGKSTVSKMLVDDGYILFDCDVVAHDFYQTESGKAAVKKLFGDAALSNDQVQIPYIREALKNNPKLIKTLQKSVHSFVRHQAKALLSSLGENDRVVIDVPLLLDGKMQGLCDYIILVDSNESARRQRLLNEGRDADGLLSINAHYPYKETKAIADALIHNDGSIEELRRSVEALFRFRNQSSAR